MNERRTERPDCGGGRVRASQGSWQPPRSEVQGGASGQPAPPDQRGKRSAGVLWMKSRTFKTPKRQLSLQSFSVCSFFVWYGIVCKAPILKAAPPLFISSCTLWIFFLLPLHCYRGFVCVRACVLILLSFTLTGRQQICHVVLLFCSVLSYMHFSSNLLNNYTIYIYIYYMKYYIQLHSFTGSADHHLNSTLTLCLISDLYLNYSTFVIFIEQ